VFIEVAAKNTEQDSTNHKIHKQQR